MISDAFGTPMPSAGSWNCSAVAAPDRRHASAVPADPPFAEYEGRDRKVAAPRVMRSVKVADRQEGAGERGFSDRFAVYWKICAGRASAGSPGSGPAKPI